MPVNNTFKQYKILCNFLHPNLELFWTKFCFNCKAALLETFNKFATQVKLAFY
jgi:hypothetical protein